MMKPAGFCTALLLLIAAAPAPAQEAFSPPPEPPPLDAASELAGGAATSSSPQQSEEPKSLFRNLYRTVDEFTLVNARPRLSFHKPMYSLPLAYTSRYPREESEFIFALSLKMQLFKSNLFFGYSQRSYWQIYNASESRPFRETDYNPEFFYRWKPDYALCPGCGLDLGFEHESNGRAAPQSRSWNRIYLASYVERNRTLVHLRGWYRIPEDDKKTPDDPDGDDNPDIARYYGYGELRVQRELFKDKHLAALMLRGNLNTGKGAVEFNYSVPFGDYLYWNVYVFNGYGESLLDYNRSLTRYGIGVMLAR